MDIFRESDSLGILAHLLRMVTEPKYISFRRWIYTLIILRKCDWIPYGWFPCFLLGDSVMWQHDAWCNFNTSDRRVALQQLPPPKINPNRRPPKTDLILRGCYELAFSHTFSFIDLITSPKILHAYTKIIYILKELPFPSRPWCSNFPRVQAHILGNCLFDAWQKNYIKHIYIYILPNGGLMGIYHGTIRRITN